MIETIIAIVCWLVYTALIVGGNVLCYRFGVKDGLRRAVIEVVKDEGILKEDQPL